MVSRMVDRFPQHVAPDGLWPPARVAGGASINDADVRRAFARGEELLCWIVARTPTCAAHSRYSDDTGLILEGWTAARPERRDARWQPVHRLLRAHVRQPEEGAPAGRLCAGGDRLLLFGAAAAGCAGAAAGWGGGHCRAATGGTNEPGFARRRRFWRVGLALRLLLLDVFIGDLGLRQAQRVGVDLAGVRGLAAFSARRLLLGGPPAASPIRWRRRPSCRTARR